LNVALIKYLKRDHRLIQDALCLLLGGRVSAHENPAFDLRSPE
jgi:hypothetical protein